MAKAGKAKVVAYGKRRIRRSRAMVPSGKRRLRTRSLIPRREVLIRKGRAKIRRILPQRKRFFRRFEHPKRLFFAFNNFDKTFKSLVRSWKRKQTEWSPIKKRTDYTKKFKKKKPTGFKKTIGVGIRRPTEERKVVEDMEPRRRRERRGGPRDMSKRKYINYGPMGELGPHLVLNLKPTAKLRAVLKQEAKTIRGSHVGDMIRRELDIIYAGITKYAEKIIAIYVPIETGDLQESMLKKLKKNRGRRGYRLRMEIGTPKVNYASPVNRMPETKIQHSRKMKRRGRRSRRYLHDPKAQKGYYGLIRMLLNTKIKKLVRQMYRNLVATTATATVIKMPRLQPKLTPLRRRQVRGYRAFRPSEIRDGFYTNIEGKSKLLGGGLMRSDIIGESGPQRFAVQGKDYLQWLEDKQRTKTERLRSMQAKSQQKQIIKYTYKDILGWFKVDVPFKR